MAIAMQPPPVGTQSEILTITPTAARPRRLGSQMQELTHDDANLSGSLTWSTQCCSIVKQQLELNGLRSSFFLEFKKYCFLNMILKQQHRTNTAVLTWCLNITRFWSQMLWVDILGTSQTYFGFMVDHFSRAMPTQMCQNDPKCTSGNLLRKILIEEVGFVVFPVLAATEWWDPFAVEPQKTRHSRKMHCTHCTVDHSQINQ